VAAALDRARAASIGDHRPVSEFEDLVAEALAAPVAGWDFSWIQSRSSTRLPPWSYERIVSGLAASAEAMLDMGTGGGEVLAGLPIRAPVTVATEAWGPNVPVATERLAPLGIEVVQVEGAPDNLSQPGAGGELPFDDEAFDLVINRHEAFVASEVARVLAPGGTFVTQQVDGGAWDDLQAALGLPREQKGSWLGLAIEQCESAGLRVIETMRGIETLRFDDVGALVYFLRVVSWAVPGFDPDDSNDALRRANDQMPLEIRQPRFLLVSER
jgi:SAM-dependent methyltransferase